MCTFCGRQIDDRLSSFIFIFGNESAQMFLTNGCEVASSVRGIYVCWIRMLGMNKLASNAHKTFFSLASSTYNLKCSLFPSTR